MPVKEASLFNIFNSISVTGSGTYTSSVTSILYRDTFNYQINYTGSPQGVLQINACNDYNPQLPQSGNPQNSSSLGTWTTVASVSMANVVNPILFNFQSPPGAFIQCQFVASSANGTLTGWIVTRSTGS